MKDVVVSPPSAIPAPAPSPPKPVVAPPQLMPSDFRDLTVGGYLPNQILAILPPAGLPFLQLPKVFQQKHGVSLKFQLKGKLAEFLETMATYDLVCLDRKGPIETWRVRPLIRKGNNSKTQLPNNAPVEEKKLEEIHI
jgi:hypothetical protein